MTPGHLWSCARSGIMGVTVEATPRKSVLVLPMSTRRKTVVIASVVVAAAMPIFCFVMFLQPWRYCPEIDDSSAGCPALDRDVAFLTGGAVTFLVAVAILLAALLLPRSTAPAPR